MHSIVKMFQIQRQKKWNQVRNILAKAMPLIPIEANQYQRNRLADVVSNIHAYIKHSFFFQVVNFFLDIYVCVSVYFVDIHFLF